MNKEILCDNCIHEKRVSPLKEYRGSCAPWMDKFYEILFCPECGQIYTRLTKDSPLFDLTIDEYEYQGN